MEDRAPFIKGEQLHLYGVDKTDLQTIHQWRHKEQIRIPYGYPAQPLTLETVASSFADDSDGNIEFIAYDPIDDQRVGLTMLVFEDHAAKISRNAEFRGLIDPEYQKQGMGRESTILTLQYGFKNLNLHKVWARVLENNDKSQSNLESRGFKREGELREEAYVDGEYQDVYVYGLLRCEWEDKYGNE